MEARIVRVVRTGAGLFDAVVEVEYRGEKALVAFPRLARRPTRAELREDAGLLVLMLGDEEGGIASCCLDPGRLGKGCVDYKCPSATPWVIPGKHLEHRDVGGGAGKG